MSDTLSPNETSFVQPGQVLVDLGGNVWVTWANGAGLVGHNIGINLSNAAPGNPIKVVTTGRVPYDGFNLGPGQPSCVVAGGVVPGRGGQSGGQLIGTCDSAGGMIMWPSYVGTPSQVGATCLGILGDAALQATPPTVNQVVYFDGLKWAFQTLAGLLPNLAGDVTGPPTSNTVVKVNGATVPASGALTTGNVLQVSGAAALSYGPVNLAGGSNYVTGTLPAGNLPNLGGDVTGAPGANTVVKIQNTPVSSSAPSNGQVLEYNGSAWAPANASNSSSRAYYGSQADGTATCDGSTAVAGMSRVGSVYTLTRNVAFATLTVNVGVTVKTAGNSIEYDTLVLNGTISNDGVAASGSTHGAGAPYGFYAGGSAGGDGGGGTAGSAGQSFSNNNIGLGGQGGTGGADGVNGGGAGGGLNNAGGVLTQQVHFAGLVSGLMAIAGTEPTVAPGSPFALAGGSGGGGGGGLTDVGGDVGGGGGGGGGYLPLRGRVRTGSGNITALGGAGGAATTSGGGGAGGGGGWITDICGDKTGWSGSALVTGGAAGAHAGTGVDGAAGGNGVYTYIQG